MASDAHKRGRTNSIAATNDHPNASSNTDNSMASQQTQDSRSQGALEIHVVDESYDIAQGNKSGGSPSPRNQSSYEPSPAEKSSRTSDQNYAPSQLDRSSRSSNTKIASKSMERQTRVATRPHPISIEPPVTKATLSELDVTKIVNNPKLRHDINFDPELHFRPNLDGDKGRRKTEKANYFWTTMRVQLQAFLTNQEQFERGLGDSEWCLPATLNAIRGILETLVPQRDKASVEETFNVELLMQQFRMGVADLVKLALWLSQLLKCHCAPMRDNWVDDMVTQLSKGNQTGDVGLLVAGMKNLLGVLEAMKLDVANHQIRCLRPLLIDDTVHFEQKFFMKKIALGRVDIGGAHSWFRSASSLPEAGSSSTAMISQTWDFMKAMVNLTLPFKADLFPHTFLFDEERLIKLRSDMLDIINLEICMQLYRNLEIQNRSYRDDTSMTSVSSPCDRADSPADELMYSQPTILSLHHFDVPQSSRQDHRHPPHHPCGRRSWVPDINGSRVGSVTCSPRSSPSSTASTPDTLPPTPLYLTPSPSDSASMSQLRSSLLAILASSTSANKWETLSPDLALQILRHTTSSLARLPQVESHLALYISIPGSKLYKEAEAHVLNHLHADLKKLVENYTPLSSLQIFEAATAPRVVSASTAALGNGFKDEITEMATRMAHIGILHWRVWAPLAYLVDPDAEEEQMPNSERAKSMP